MQLSTTRSFHHVTRPQRYHLGVVAWLKLLLLFARELILTLLPATISYLFAAQQTTNIGYHPRTGLRLGLDLTASGLPLWCCDKGDPRHGEAREQTYIFLISLKLMLHHNLPSRVMGIKHLMCLPNILVVINLCWLRIPRTFLNLLHDTLERDSRQRELRGTNVCCGTS